VQTAGVLAPAVETKGVRTVSTAGEGSFASPGRALPTLGIDGRTIAAVMSVGRGRVVLLADPSLLQNAHLGRADNAAFALGAAGPARRDVAFLESYHGYGKGSGLAAIPHRWDAALLLAAAAALVFMLSRIRRFGPPEPDARDLPPPRAAYVDALATTLARTRDRQVALEALRTELRRRVAVRAGLGPSASDEEIGQAAARLGLPPDQVATLTRATARGDELELGRALAATAPVRRRAWTN
jgi:hypothetical protein